MKKNGLLKISFVLAFAILINSIVFFETEKRACIFASEINGDLSLEEGAVIAIPEQDRMLNAIKMKEINSREIIGRLGVLKSKQDVNLKVTGYKQITTYYCGPATTQQTLGFFLKANQIPTQDVLANKDNLKTTKQGMDMTLISGVINKYLKKYSHKVSYSMVEIGTEKEWKKKILSSLSNNKPVILDIDSSSYSGEWGYYTTGHFLNVSGYRINKGKEEIKVTDPALSKVREKWHPLSLVYKVNKAHWRKSMIW